MGQSPEWIAEQAGFAVPAGTSIILVEVSRVGPQEPLTREKLAPVLAVLRADSREHGLTSPRRWSSSTGWDTAPSSTPRTPFAETFGRRVKAVRVIWNAPSSQGAIGDIYNAFLPSLTLGCGSYGRNSVSNNVSAVNLLNIKRVGRRTNNLQWFKVPAEDLLRAAGDPLPADMPDVSGSPSSPTRR